MTRLDERLATVADNAGFAPPVGSIIPYFPGYYGAAANGGGFTEVGPGANSVAGVNAFTSDNWRVCDGTAPNDAESPIFNAAGRHLPELTDSRFHRGASSAGAAGGATSNTITLNTPQLPPHGHSVSVSTNPTSLAHDHEPGGTAPTVNAPATASHGHVGKNNAAFPTGGAVKGYFGVGPSPGVNNARTMAMEFPAPSNPAAYLATNATAVASSSTPHNTPHSHTLVIPTENIPHSHPVTLNQSNVGAGDSINIEPQYVSLFYIMRIK